LPGEAIRLTNPLNAIKPWPKSNAHTTLAGFGGISPPSQQPVT